MTRATLFVTAAPVVLLCIFASVAEACGTRGGTNNSPKTTDIDPHYEDGTLSVRKTSHSVRLRRSLSQTVDDANNFPLEALNVEVFSSLDMDGDDALSVVDWWSEGGSVKDFWALLTDHDMNGDERISYPEFSSIAFVLRGNEARRSRQQG